MSINKPNSDSGSSDPMSHWEQILDSDVVEFLENEPGKFDQFVPALEIPDGEEGNGLEHDLDTIKELLNSNDIGLIFRAFELIKNYNTSCVRDILLNFLKKAENPMILTKGVAVYEEILPQELELSLVLFLKNINQRFQNNVNTIFTESLRVKDSSQDVNLYDFADIDDQTKPNLKPLDLTGFKKQTPQEEFDLLINIEIKLLNTITEILRQPRNSEQVKNSVVILDEFAKINNEIIKNVEDNLSYLSLIGQISYLLPYVYKLNYYVNGFEDVSLKMMRGMSELCIFINQSRVNKNCDRQLIMSRNEAKKNLSKIHDLFNFLAKKELKKLRLDKKHKKHIKPSQEVNNETSGEYKDELQDFKFYFIKKALFNGNVKRKNQALSLLYGLFNNQDVNRVFEDTKGIIKQNIIKLAKDLLADLPDNYLNKDEFLKPTLEEISSHAKTLDFLSKVFYFIKDINVLTKVKKVYYCRACDVKIRVKAAEIIINVLKKSGNEDILFNFLLSASRNKNVLISDFGMGELEICFNQIDKKRFKLLFNFLIQIIKQKEYINTKEDKSQLRNLQNVEVRLYHYILQKVNFKFENQEFKETICKLMQNPDSKINDLGFQFAIRLADYENFKSLENFIEKSYYENFLFKILRLPNKYFFKTAKFFALEKIKQSKDYDNLHILRDIYRSDKNDNLVKKKMLDVLCMLGDIKSVRDFNASQLSYIPVALVKRSMYSFLKVLNIANN
jgi:hypothetical protein